MTLFEILPNRIVTSDVIMYLEICPYNDSEYLYNVVVLEGEDKIPRALLFTQTSINIDKDKTKILIKFFEDNMEHGSLFFKDNEEINIKKSLDRLVNLRESTK